MIILCFAFFEDLLNSFLQQLPCIFFEEMSTQDICPFFQDQIKSGTFRVVWLFLMPIFKSICCCFCCGSWIVGVLLCISGYYFLIRWIICKYFLPFNRPPFHFLKVSYLVQNFKFLTSSLSMFCCCSLCFWCHIQEIISTSNIIRPFLCFLQSLTVLALMFRSLIHFELIFVYGVR